LSSDPFSSPISWGLVIRELFLTNNQLHSHSVSPKTSSIWE
jgi:hypothetical protein